MLDMGDKMKSILLAAVCLLTILASTVHAQSGIAPVTVEAENGTLGADFAIETDTETDIVSIYPTTDWSDTEGSVTSRPATAARVSTFTVTFPVAGEFTVYARMANGPDQFSDDSFFLGSDFFGVKDPTVDGDWRNCNGVAGIGFVDENVVVGGINLVNGEEVVDTGSGNLHETFKWVNLSSWGGCQAIATVEPGSLTQTFSYGAREDGLWVDKFVFGLSGDLFTVGDLEAGRAASGKPPKEPTPPIADGKDKFLGSAFSASQSRYFEYYFNQVTPENSGKWDSVESTRDTMDWEDLDTAYALAVDNGLPFRMHVLIWGNQQPAWMESLTPEEQLEEITEWFDAVAERYPAIDVLEVVNEPVNDPPAGEGNGNYIDALGGAADNAWLKTAFMMAREKFPDALLAINEYNVLNGGVLDAYKAMIEDLHAEGLVDIIGVQGHAFSTRGSSAGMQAALDSLGEIGLPIHVTEMDIDGIAGGGIESDMTQLADYKRIFPILWEHEAVEGVTLWGYRPGLWRDAMEAYIVRANDDDRPAAIWLRSYVGGENEAPVIDTSVTTITVDEELLEGTTIAYLSADDPDGENDNLSNWTIVGGTGLGLLDIDPFNGELFIAAGETLDYETSPSYTVEIIVMDELFTDSEIAVFTVNLNDIENDGETGDVTIWEPIPNREKTSGGGSLDYLLLLLLASACLGAKARSGRSRANS